MRCIKNYKNYKNMSKERLWSAIDESESTGSGDNFENARIKKILKNLTN